MTRHAITAALVLLVVPTAVSAKEEKNSLTHGMVQMNVKVGVTTQAEIVEAFGAPNITTLDGSGQEMWVYDR
jgi:hypothetical protein